MLINFYQTLVKCDLINLALKILGIDLYSSQRGKIFKHAGLFFFPAIITSTMNIASLVWSLNDFSMVMHSFYMFVQGMLVVIKILTFLLKKEKFVNLMRDITKLAERANRAEYEIWETSSRQQRRIISFYLIMCLLTGMVYGLSPLLISFFYYLNTGEFELIQPYWAIFPHDSINPALHYTLCYMLFIPLAWFFLPSSFSIDSLYSWYIFKISAHFRILEEKLRIIEKLMKEDNLRLLKIKFQDFFHYHCQVIELVNEFENVFKDILFAEVLLCSFLICFIMIQYGIVVNLSDLPFLSLFTSAMIIQLSIYCLGGQFLKNRSNDLNASLNLPWYYLPPKWRHLLLMPMMRTQKSCTLKCYFFEIASPLLVGIYNSAWSFAAFVKAMNEQIDE